MNVAGAPIEKKMNYDAMLDSSDEGGKTMTTSNNMITQPNIHNNHGAGPS